MADPTPDRNDRRHVSAKATGVGEGRSADAAVRRAPAGSDDELQGEQEAIVEGRPADLPAVMTRDTRGG